MKEDKHENYSTRRLVKRENDEEELEVVFYNLRRHVGLVEIDVKRDLPE